ncbi:ATP-binding protein [Magnetospirillum sp. UT-4]|uniref:sensor histidine kinase n=1 Tax=Magnetospirillum sp. UT-4 TaxID=2681467 RepID=UPI0013806618|nr:Signal transduction histidine kinase [Magnetospirillum sp. UT-4]
MVDDDDQVHAMTRVLLRDFELDGRGFEVLSAHSAAAAASLLAGRDDIPVVLLDVVMETPDAGLKLVRHIREDLGNRTLRIILRTGQPGEAPERDVVIGYDVNDYKSKAELTAQKLFTALVGAVRAWRDLVTIARLNAELTALNASLEGKVVARTADLAEAKAEVEAALASETEAKGRLRQFLSMVSHEFRTPLAIIDSAAQMLALRAERGDTGMLPRLDTVRGAVRRLIELIDTCLADEQLDSGRLVPQPQAIDLAQMLAAAVDHHRAAAPEREFRLDAPAALPAWGDPSLLAMVFNNLIGNAVKYSAEGAIEITARSGPDGAVIGVRDHGIGIPAGDLGRIFDRFYRAANATLIPGSGIGLHMVRQIAELHGGSIAAGNAPSGGAIFTLRLGKTGGGSA